MSFKLTIPKAPDLITTGQSSQAPPGTSKMYANFCREHRGAYDFMAMHCAEDDTHMVEDFHDQDQPPEEPNQQPPIHTTSLAKMSAYQVFQDAYSHAQLARPPDEEHTFPSSSMDMDEWDKLPPDCQAFIEILADYGMVDDVGLYIYKNYPEVAARI